MRHGRSLTCTALIIQASLFQSGTVAEGRHRSGHFYLVLIFRRLTYYTPDKCRIFSHTFSECHLSLASSCCNIVHSGCLQPIPLARLRSVPSVMSFSLPCLALVLLYRWRSETRDDPVHKPRSTKLLCFVQSWYNLQLTEVVRSARFYKVQLLHRGA